MTITFGTEQELAGWMCLVERVKDAFPGLETPEALREHRNTVLNFMRSGAAICAKEQGEIVGVLLFSREAATLCFLAVDPAYRRQHIAEKMLSYMFTQMDPLRGISVTTYRDGVPEGTAARAFYRRMGFVEGRLCEEFGSPVQEFVLKR